MPNPIPTGGLDPAYPVGPGGITPGYTGPGAVTAASFGAQPGPGAFGGMPMPFQAGAGGILNGPGYQLPPLQAAGYNPGGGFMPAPIGGMWNQIAQQMAGPMFMPQGVSTLGGPANPLGPAQPSAVTVPGFQSPTGAPYLNPHLFVPTTPIQQPRPVAPPVTVPVIPPGVPLNGGGGVLGGAGSALGGGFIGGGTGYRSPIGGRLGIERF